MKLKTLNEWLNEAFPLSVAKKYTQYKENRIESDFENKVFGNKNRIYIPLQKINPKKASRNIGLTIENRVENTLRRDGYEVIDYVKGTCKKIGDTKNIYKIGKVLNKLNRDVELKSFNNDFARNLANQGTDNLEVVISRHAYDIAGMSTGRGWTSCLEIGKENEKYIQPHIELGSLIAYVIDKSDRNIRSPKSRILINPYKLFRKSPRHPEVTKYFSAKIYGTFVPGFKETIDNWLEENQDIPYGTYSLSGGLYADDLWFKTKLHPLKDLKTKELVLENIKALHLTKYKINDDLSVDIDGNVSLTTCDLTEIPLNFNKVNGNFIIYNNKLTSLEGSPKIVRGSFDCSHNKLKNLKGSPEIVRRNFSCQRNSITTLVGGPREVNGDYNCSENKLENLKGMPEYEVGHLTLAYNPLKSIEGISKRIPGFTRIEFTELRDLEVSYPVEFGTLSYTTNEHIPEDYKVPDNIKAEKLF